MGDHDDILNQIKNSGFLKDLISDNVHQTFFSVSVINSICDDFVDISDDEKITKYLISCKEKISMQCSKILRLSDIFSRLSNIVDGNEMSVEKIDIPKYLSEFAVECQTQLKGRCEISYIPGSDDITETIMELLELCLIMYVRKAVIKGAESISFTNTSETEYVVIHSEITRPGTAAEPENMHETFTFDYADAIISAVIKKLNGKFLSADREMKLYIPQKNSGYSTLKSSSKTRGKSAFNIFKNMLSDLGDITII